MAGYICIGVLAAFGALSFLWAMFGWLLPGNECSLIVYWSTPGRFSVGRYIVLRELGLLNCPLLVVDRGIPPEDRKWLAGQRGKIELCSPEELTSRLEWERNRVD